MGFIRWGGFRRALRSGRFWGAAVALAVVGAGAGAGVFYWTFLRDLPDFHSIEDYRPALHSRVLDRNGKVIGEFYVDERRVLVPFDEIPEHVRMAFVSAEDKVFFEHKGIDYRGIVRAALANFLHGGIQQGASTITMQTVKRLILTPERTYRRKIQEAILARRLEERFTKEQILYLYLSEIYFGEGAYGIGEAARTYFDKTAGELTVSEAAMLAGLPQRPSAYDPFHNYEAADTRRRYVLGRMLEDGVIDRAQYDEALAHPPELHRPAYHENFAPAAYFTEEVRRTLFDALDDDTVLRGGLTIETTLDIDLQKAAVEAVREGLREHDRRQGWRGPLRRVAAAEISAEIESAGRENGLLPEEDETAQADDETRAAQADDEARAEASADATAADAEAVADAGATGEPAAEADESDEEEGPTSPLPFDEPLVGVVTEVDGKAQSARVAFAPEVFGEVRLADVDWARKPNPSVIGAPVKKITHIFRTGMVARFERLPDEIADAKRRKKEPELEPGVARVGLFQEPRVQGALFSVDVASGDVLAMVGGYDFDQSQFNRATQARRQPGSAFKPFIYGAALERDYTPVSLLYDRPVVYVDPVSGFAWRPQNYGRSFYGPIPLRTALVRSVNNATVHLFRDVGVDYVIDYARRLGIRSPLNRDLSLALGSSDLSLTEITCAYATFPNGGRRVVPRFISRVTDREGNVLLEDVLVGEPPEPVTEPLDHQLDEKRAPGPVAEAALAAQQGRTPQDRFYPDVEEVPPDQVVSPAEAYLMVDLLHAVVTDPHGTGWRLRRLGRPVAGKTGTTNDQNDAWFVGFSPEIATGVWVGYDESRFLGKNETGGRAAAPIWVDYMRQALHGRPVHDFEPPDGIVFQRIDRSTGLVADGRTKDAYFQPFLEGTEPTSTSDQNKMADESDRLLRLDSF